MARDLDRPDDIVEALTLGIVRTACPHCGAVVLDARAHPFCCLGCQGAYDLLRTAHLQDYYALREGPGRPVTQTESPDHKWIESLEATIRAGSPLARVDVDIQGVHCSACVWLIERLFTRRAGQASIVVNPAIGRVQLVVSSAFDLGAFVSEIERFGYILGPARKSERRASTDTIWRMGVCVAIAMNSMIFAIAMYAGLHDGPLFILFQRLNLGLSTVSLVVGGPVFFRSAWQGVRRRVLHLDVPISLGILLAFAGSVYAYTRGSTASYVDTLNVFIALMLVGRWLRERVLERNRLEVLASDGADDLLTRRRVGNMVTTAPCTAIRTDDILVLSPGDLVPVDGRLLGDSSVNCSLDWINGESTPRQFTAGSVIPAGAFLAGRSVAEVVALTAFEGSALVDLLRTPVSRDADQAMQTPWWQRLTRIYVVVVLVLAAIGGAGWMLTGHPALRALEVVTAVLIVTCPCAFGLATPLAYDLAQTRLRRAGLYIRSPGFLDRAALVRTVVFDKTGTLTAATAVLENPEALDALTPAHRGVLRHLADRSHHPKAAAVRTALSKADGAATGEPIDASVTEWPGLGLEVLVGSDRYRLGAGHWASPSGTDRPEMLVFSAGTEVLATLTCREQLRADAAREVGSLQTEGYDVWLLSGDEPDRVREVAARCGLPRERAIGGASPQGKDDWLRAHDHGDVLMVGDGINDTLVVEHAFCSGTPAVERPFMSARSDFYFMSPGLSPIRSALHAAKAIARVRSMNLTIAVAYNIAAVGLAYAGLMSPLLCAVLMPLSSLTTIGATRLALSDGSRLWKSS